MHYEKISYSKTFPVSMYVNEKIGIDLVLNEGDNPDHAIKEAKEKVEEWHKELNQKRSSYLEATTVSEPLPSIQSHAPESKEDYLLRMERDIQSCSDLKILESYKFIVKQNPQLQVSYANKLLELQTPKIKNNGKK